MFKSIKTLGLTALLLAGAAVFSHAQAQDKKPANDKPATTLENFDYASHRTGYKGKIFNYNLLSNGAAAQSDKEGVNIEPIWFWDIDNDGKFGEAETRALKAGIQVYMNPAFNDAANAKFWEISSDYSSLKEKLAQAEKDSGAKDKANHDLIGRMQKDLDDLRAKIAAGNQLLSQPPALLTPLPPPTTDVPNKDTYAQNQPLPIPETPKDLEQKAQTPERSNALPLSFVAGLDYSGNSNAAGITIGGRWGYREDSVNIALTGIYQRGLSNESFNQSATTQDPVSSAGLYGEHTINTATTNSNFNIFGGDVSLYLGNEKARAVFGLGYRHLTYDWSQTINSTTTVKRGNLVLSQNNYSENPSGNGSDNFLAFSLGADFGMGPVNAEIDLGLEISLGSGQGYPSISSKISLPPSKYKKQ